MLLTSSYEETGIDRRVRVLRWAFRRDAEAIAIKLSLTDDHSAYELRIHPPWNRVGTTIERFDDVMSAFERHTNIERILLGEGWWLESFESRPESAS